MHTKVVTLVAASAAVNAPPVTVTAVPALRLLVDEVSFGVHEAGAVPPVMVMGTLAAVLPLLMATTTVVLPPLKAESRTLALVFPATATAT